MLHLYFGIGLAALALVAAGLSVREQSRWGKAQAVFADAGGGIPLTVDQAAVPNMWRLLFFLLLLIATLIAPMPPSILYKAAIGFALLLFLLAELLLAIPGTPTIVRTGLNCAMYFVLWLGFAATTGGALWSLWGLTALIPLALAAGYWWLLRPRLGDLQISVGVYVLNAALVAAFATSLAATQFSQWSLLALVGAIALLLADALRGWHRFRGRIVRLPMYEMVAYLAAWLLLGASVWGQSLTVWN